MKLTRFLATIILGFFCVLSTIAQPLSSTDLSKIKVDDLSDDEISTYYQKAIASGLSEAQLYQLAADRGLPAVEVAKLKQRVAASVGASTLPSTGTGPKQENSPARVYNASPSTATTAVIVKDNSTFGSELFNSNSTVFEPNINIATPANYILGPDDEIVLLVFGQSEQTYNLKISPEGNIYIPRVGPLYVNGLSMEQATEKIKNKLASTIYSAIRSGQTKVQVTLGNIRSIHVTVIGQARKPGTYIVSSLTTLFNLLYLCGGPADNGSFRNIELIRGKQAKRKIDIYNFLTKGDLKDNLLLQELDVIRIPYYTTKVSLSGEVKREGKFELQAGETLNQLITYAGGFSDSAYKASVKVVQLTDREKKITDITAAAFDTYLPASSDHFYIGKILDRFTNRVTILGSVFRPGDYEMTEGMSLKTLLEKAGGIKEDAYVDRGTIARLNADLSPINVAFNIKEILTGQQDVTLKKEDIVSISSITSLKNKYFINIEGEVKKPGEIPWKENLTVKDVVLIAGGLTEYANPATIDVSRRVKDADITKKEFRQAEILKVDLSKGLLSTAQDIVLQPFDIIIVRPQPTYVKQRLVMVTGQVKNEGKYALESNNERISDLVRRFDGFKAAADSNSVTLRRVAKLGLTSDEKKVLFERLLSIDSDSLNKNVKLRTEIYKDYDLISLNLQAALDKPYSNDDLILEDGDLITVERASNLIRVSGEVNYPTIIPFHPGESLKYYVQQAGNYTYNARRRSSIVIYPDGKAKTVSSFLFFKSYPNITPRADIFIPSKNAKAKSRITTGEWVAISSIFATLATLLVTAFK